MKVGTKMHNWIGVFGRIRKENVGKRPATAQGPTGRNDPTPMIALDEKMFFFYFFYFILRFLYFAGRTVSTEARGMWAVGDGR